MELNLELPVCSCASRYFTDQHAVLKIDADSRSGGDSLGRLQAGMSAVEGIDECGERPRSIQQTLR